MQALRDAAYCTHVPAGTPTTAVSSAFVSKVTPGGGVDYEGASIASNEYAEPEWARRAALAAAK